MNSDTPRTDAASFSSRDPLELLQTIQKLERELAISLQNADKLQKQLKRAVEIAEAYQRGNSGLHYQCNCASCQLLGDLKGEIK
jgi:fructose-1,6-bisphosphatase